MEAITCILCGLPNNHVAITENEYSGLKCKNCGLIYISPRPSAEEMTSIYTSHHAVLYADAQFRFEGFKRMEARKTLSRINNYRKSCSILELGPGGGFFLMEARNYGYEPYGIELNPIESRWIKENLHIPCETVALNKNSFGGRQFDIIYHRDVLSHFYDPIRVFRDINQSMKKNGLLIFETGNIADVKEKHYKWFSQFSYPDHLFFFGEKSLATLLDRTGFRCLRIYKDVILLQLLLQKLLWGMKDPLKDDKAAEDMRQQKDLNSVGNGHLSMKRRLRLIYRYVRHYLVKVGTILPKNGWPLKLLVIAEKK